jgi:hypothetical protein
MDNFYRGKLSFNETYKHGFNIENIPTRVFYIVLGIFAEIPISITSDLIVTAVMLLFGIFGIDIKFDLRDSNFINVFISVMPLFSLHILLFIIFRFAAKLRTCYFDLTVILLTVLGIFSPYLKESTGWKGFLTFEISILYLCTAISFILFTVAFVLLERIKRLRDWQRTMFALFASILFGALFSWLALVLITGKYLH